MSRQDKASHSARNPNRRKGFTLVDVMIAVGVASIMLLALFGTSFLTYKINHKARLRDNARAVLRTFVDQFQRLSYSDEETGSNQPREIFITTTGSNSTVSAPTSSGLEWGKLNTFKPDGTVKPPCIVNIGTPDAPQLATVTRDVWWIEPSTGNATASKSVEAAGFMLKGRFTITYTLTGTTGRSISQSMTTLRLVP